MDNTQEKLRVSYRFNPGTVELLKQMQTIPPAEQPLFSNRSMTWLIEYAIATIYQPIIDAAAEPVS